MPGFELIGREEKNEINDLLNNSGIFFRHGFDNIRNDIFKVREFEKNFSAFMGVNDSLAVTSGTAALKVALKAFGVGPGDEVITSAFTFVATVEAIVEVGAKPIIANIDSSLNINLNSIKDNFSKKTKAVIVVHMLGVPCFMTDIVDFCKNNSIYLIEDTAWGCGGEYKNKKLGTIGDCGTYSFDFAKTITTGEGGMLVFKDSEFLEIAKAYHDHGHENNPSLPRWEDSRKSSGFNYRMTELQGAVGIAQLKKLDFIVSKQIKNKNRIINLLKNLPNYEFRTIPNNSVDTSDALIVITKSNEIAKSIRNDLLKAGYSTKILPEAISWHFAGMWDHIKELDLKNLKSLEISLNILNRCVALPISVNYGFNDDSLMNIFTKNH